MQNDELFHMFILRPTHTKFQFMTIYAYREAGKKIFCLLGNLDIDIFLQPGSVKEKKSGGKPKTNPHLTQVLLLFAREGGGCVGVVHIFVVSKVFEEINVAP